MKIMIGLVAILLVLGIFVTANIFAEDAVYTISALKGKVLIKRAGTEDWIEAKVGDSLYKDDAVKTLDDGYLYLETGPSVGFTVGPNSEFLVANIFEQLPVAEPYTEAGGGESPDSVIAPGVNQEGAASRI